MKTKYSYIEAALERRMEQKHYAHLRIAMPGDEQALDKVNLSTNDYLGLANHPHVKKTTIQYVLKWGAGSSPSRLVASHLESHHATEEKLAKLLGTEDALLISSSFQINSAILKTLAQKKSMIFIDKACQNSLIQAAVNTGAQVIRYEHNNIEELKSLLEKHAKEDPPTKLIVSESLFSLEGDSAPMNSLISLARKHEALLYIDDSHAVGVLGKYGMGIAAQRKGVDIMAGSFSKACGSFGAYIGCSRLLKEYLIHFCPGLLSQAPMPPAALGAITAALELIPDMVEERKRIQEYSGFLRQELKKGLFSTGMSTNHIIPISLQKEEETLQLIDHLKEEGFLVLPIPGKPKLKLNVHAQLSHEQLSKLSKLLLDWKKAKTKIAVA